MDFGTGEYIILCNFDGGIMSDFKVFERGVASEAYHHHLGEC